MENALSEHQQKVDELMMRTLQCAQEQIKTYVDEQRKVCGLLLARVPYRFIHAVLYNLCFNSIPRCKTFVNIR